MAITSSTISKKLPQPLYHKIQGSIWWLHLPKDLVKREVIMSCCGKQRRAFISMESRTRSLPLSPVTVACPHGPGRIGAFTNRKLEAAPPVIPRSQLVLQFPGNIIPTERIRVRACGTCWQLFSALFTTAANPGSIRQPKGADVCETQLCNHPF